MQPLFFSILRSKRLNLKYHTASLLEVESGSNDPCAYMLTMIMLSIIGGDSMTVPHLIYLVFAQIVYGAVTGVIAAVVTGFIMKKYPLPHRDLTQSLCLPWCCLPMQFRAKSRKWISECIHIWNYLGNMELNHKKPMVNFFDGLTGLMQMLLFFLLGLLSFPSVLPQVLLPAVAIALFLTLVARPLTVFALLSPFGCPLKQQLLVALAGLRGAASVVFAIMTVTHPANIENDLFHIVFCIVLFSILIQGMFLPVMAKKLDMIDEKEDVLKTFTDYTEEVPVQFIQFTVYPGSLLEWKAGKRYHTSAGNTSGPDAAGRRNHYARWKYHAAGGKCPDIKCKGNAGRGRSTSDRADVGQRK